METTKITEGNKLIAEFMAVINNFSDYYYMPQFGHYFNSYGNIEFNETFRSDELKYHTSWGWLMPVVEKIENLYDGDVLVEISDEKCYIGYGSFYQNTATAETKIKAVYGAVVEFIKWYNLE